jgi:hypothetical protein
MLDLPRRFGVLLSTGVVLLAMAAGPAAATPSFAAQTGQSCQSCHVGGFGPQLTAFGREFKLRGYTQRWSKSLPFSAMAVASYVRTQANPASPPAAGFKVNDNVTPDQVSLFLAGGLGSHLGAFVQTTYDGVGKAWSWDNLDLRATTTAHIKGAEVVMGVSLNNSPGVQDAWNTLPARGYPYTDSALAPSPSASPLLAGALAQNTMGMTGYLWINSMVFIEGGAYGSPARSTLQRLGADPFDPGDIKGLAPYGRVALQTSVASGVLQVGAFGMSTDIHPGRDRLTGVTDRFTDLGLDGSYQKALDNGDVVTFDARYLHEGRRLDASCALAGAVGPGCTDASLTDVRADASYYWRNRIGATVAVFDTSGGANPDIYPDNRTFKPDSNGMTLQLDGTPFGDGKSPLGRRFNIRLGVQYTMYGRFEGARSNYDGAGAKASDNNTFRAFAWVAY